jgi:glucosamine 6-phosphate synthetase-like amidotransferase/phosphosugar isomerase protein
MCGIIRYTVSMDANKIILNKLKRLEYKECE